MIRYLAKLVNWKQTTKFIIYFLFSLAGFLVSQAYADHAEDFFCPTLREGDQVIVRNVGDIGLNVREEADGDKKNIRLPNGTEATILNGPKPFGHHIWYEVEWDIPINGIRDGWVAGIIGDQGEKFQTAINTLKLHRAGAKAAAERRVEHEQWAEIASALFKLPASDTNYAYNDYGCEPRDADGYRGGHSGWDAQTADAYGYQSRRDLVNAPFYSLTSGTVIRVKPGDVSDLSVIAVHSNDEMTTFYLHARRIFVFEGQKVEVGDCLGIQGNTGLWPKNLDALSEADRKAIKPYESNPQTYSEHVHVEVRKGKSQFTAYGAGISQEGRHPTIDPVPYLYRWITDGVENRFSPADVNQDGFVGLVDARLVAENIGETDPQFDINSDGIVSIADVAEVVKYFMFYLQSLEFCPAAPGSFSDNRLEYTGVPADQVSVRDEIVSQEAVQQLLGTLREIDDGSLTFSQVIAILESFLHPTILEKTTLFANYPNPFNPETWIPYYLATDTDVTITIYDATGNLVRHLDVGHQEAGYYTSRNRAAYWNGRSETGERVASGVYFYTFTTDKNAATRKMVILK